MTCARHAWIERVYCSQNLQGFLGSGQRRVQQRGLVGSVSPGFVARAGIPSGRHDRLVILDLLVFDHDPVRKRATRRFVRANTLHFMGRQHRWIVDRVVALRDVVNEQLQMLLRQFCQHASANRASSMASQRGMKSSGRCANSADRCNFLDR